MLPNFIQVNEKGQHYCTKCMEDVSNLIAHLRMHGMIPERSQWGSSQRPYPPEILTHEALIEPLLAKVASGVHIPDSREGNCTCEECQALYDELNAWYVRYAEIRRAFGM